MCGTVAFLLLACVSAVFVNAFSPPYYEALESYVYAHDGLRNILLSIPEEELPITDYRRHYLVISNFVAQFALTLSGCFVPSYNDTYLDELNKQIPYALDHSVEVVHTARSLVNKTYESIRELVQLIDELCAGETTEQCNRLLNVVIQLDEEKYGVEANVLLALGDASKEYMKIVEWLYVTSGRYDEIAFLINGRDNLRPLILKLADVFSIVNGNRASC